MACRGSGQVISNLGGAAGKLTCPWCAGEGVRVPGIDAQARWLERADGHAHEQGGETPAPGAEHEPA
jgi:2-polyprenyl-3-methyl-5-hydroxy-6-metoxy-1,4-benzoquinol methylase